MHHILLYILIACTVKESNPDSRDTKLHPLQDLCRRVPELVFAAFIPIKIALFGSKEACLGWIPTLFALVLWLICLFPWKKLHYSTGAFARRSSNHVVQRVGADACTHRRN